MYIRISIQIQLQLFNITWTLCYCSLGRRATYFNLSMRGWSELLCLLLSSLAYQRFISLHAWCTIDIVLFYSSPTYLLHKFLVKLLSLLTGSNSSFVCNSRISATFVHYKSLDTDEIFVSLDGVSFFTRLSIDLALQVAQRCPETNNTSLTLREYL